MIHCSTCESYNRGNGQKACLRCKKYLDMQIKSVKRVQINTHHIPQEIIDNIPDPRTRDLIGIIRTMPLQYAVPIMMQSALNMSLQDIAEYHHISKSGARKRILIALEIIKESAREG